MAAQENKRKQSACMMLTIHLQKLYASINPVCQNFFFPLSVLIHSFFVFFVFAIIERESLKKINQHSKSL